MKIVIDIPNEIYKKYMDDRTHTTDVLHSVRKGTPLPEHHGRLIDADKLIRDTIKNPVHAPYIHIIDMKDAPTIIEGSDSE